MNFKKIALIVFLIGLIILSIGFIIFVSREQGRKNNLQTKILFEPRSGEADKLENNQKNNPALAPIPSEEAIQTTIQETKQQISQEAEGRAFTDEELFFISNPRQAAIDKINKK